MFSPCALVLLFCGTCVPLIFDESPRIISPPSTAQTRAIAETFFQVYRSNMPIVLLIDNAKSSHEDALTFYQDINRLGLNTVMQEFVLMKFNSTGNFSFSKTLLEALSGKFSTVTGTSPILASNLKSAEIFEKLLRWSDEEMLHSVGFENSAGSALFFSLLQAIYQMPRNSGVLVFTSRTALDEDLAALAVQEAAKKRIRVSGQSAQLLLLFSVQIFVVWGANPAQNRERVIEEAAVHSGGAFFISKAPNLSENSNVGVIDVTRTKVRETDI